MVLAECDNLINYFLHGRENIVKPQSTWQKTYGIIALYPGLLTPAFVTCSTNMEEGLVKLSCVCGGVACDGYMTSVPI